MSVSPKSLFKLDGTGTGISLVLALVLLLPLNNLFGFHPLCIGGLIVYAAFLLMYDIHCRRMADVNRKPKVGFLIVFNTLFMLISATVQLYPEYRPTVLGTLYLLGEIIIIFVLIVIQFKTLKEK
ncbi:MAG: hypothetical protein QY332_02015 [Anaerolineales bacterium]|nr:MAG: hypothetical protein QY332_02015 [Anaerolineales bacterium]